MWHEQQDPAVRSRLALLLPLLALSLLAPIVIDYHEQQRAYQWEQMLRQQWHPMPVLVSLPATPLEETLQPPELATASEDVQEWKSIEVEPEPVPTPEPPAGKPPAKPAGKPVEKNVTKQVIAARPSQKQTKHLKLKLPENPYHGEVAKWEEQPPLPDLFAPRPAEPERVQLGGRLITDDKVLENNPDATFLDTIKGAEVDISIKTP